MLFYSVLLLAAAKPACDYIVKIVAKNTDDKINQIINVLSETVTRKEILDEIERLVLKNNMSRDEVLIGFADMLSKQVSRTNELSHKIAELRKQTSPSKSNSELQKIHKEVVGIRKLVLEDRTNFHEPTKSNIAQVIDDCKSGFAEVNHRAQENRIVAHNDALSLHAEHVQMYRR